MLVSNFSHAFPSWGINRIRSSARQSAKNDGDGVFLINLSSYGLTSAEAHFAYRRI